MPLRESQHCSDDPAAMNPPIEQSCVCGGISQFFFARLGDCRRELSVRGRSDCNWRHSPGLNRSSGA